MKQILIFFFTFSILGSSAQYVVDFEERELQLKTYLDQLRTAKNDEQKEVFNALFKEYLHETIQQNGAFDYAFSKLKTLGTIKSPDNSFRLFNWNVELDDHSNKYYCYILRFDAKKKDWKTIELLDNSMMLPSQPDDILTENNWYGALYYKIIPIEKSKKTIYTVLGWDGNSMVSNVKLIDVLSFNGDHVKIGSPIFKMNGEVHKRLFFEHSKRAFMSLNYDQVRNRIIFDHLSPETPGLEGFREYYVPDLSYDELKYYNNKWHHKEDVVGVNNPNQQKTHRVAYSKTKKDGSVVIVQKEEKSKWIDPSDVNSPNGGNNHVAHLPSEDKNLKNNSLNKSNDKNSKANSSRAKQTYRKGEFSMNPFVKNKKIKR
jgi:hypothetical protein